MQQHIFVSYQYYNVRKRIDKKNEKHSYLEFIVIVVKTKCYILSNKKKNQHCWQQFMLKNRHDTSEKRSDGTNSSRLLYLRTSHICRIQCDYHIERQIISKDVVLVSVFVISRIFFRIATSFGPSQKNCFFSLIRYNCLQF